MLAFQLVYAWNHETAVIATVKQAAERFGWGWRGGIYINYGFLALWIGDVCWWWLAPRSHSTRSMRIEMTRFALFTFMFLNGAVVFASGVGRLWGLLRCQSRYSVSSHADLTRCSPNAEDSDGSAAYSPGMHGLQSDTPISFAKARLTYIELQCINLLRMDMSKDLVAASATPLVLAILAEGDSYGYAIIKRVAELSGGHLQWTDGMLYPVLHRLERQGHVAAKWSASETGRKRKYYRITKEGRAQLAAQREQWKAVDGTLRGIWMQACTV